VDCRAAHIAEIARIGSALAKECAASAQGDRMSVAFNIFGSGVISGESEVAAVAGATAFVCACKDGGCPKQMTDQAQAELRESLDHYGVWKRKGLRAMMNTDAGCLDQIAVLDLFQVGYVCAERRAGRSAQTRSDFEDAYRRILLEMKEPLRTQRADACFEVFANAVGTSRAR
jgi:hypothetical protein